MPCSGPFRPGTTARPAATTTGHCRRLIVNGYAYIGVASLGDCPLVQGQLLQVDLATHQIVNTLDMVPSGSAGGGIWTSPAYDPARNEIFTVTGTETSDSETYAQAVVGINASTLAVEDYWHLPESGGRRRFRLGPRPPACTPPPTAPPCSWPRTRTATRTRSTGRIWPRAPSGSIRPRSGNDCAVCGYSTVSSAAIAQGLVFQAGGVTTVNGVGYGGSVQALNENTGAVVWQHPGGGPGHRRHHLR